MRDEDLLDYLKRFSNLINQATNVIASMAVGIQSKVLDQEEERNSTVKWSQEALDKAKKRNQ